MSMFQVKRELPDGYELLLRDKHNCKTKIKNAEECLTTTEVKLNFKKINKL